MKDKKDKNILPEKATFRKYMGREDYYKYESVRDELIKAVDAKLTAKEAAQKLLISTTTFYKYKSMLSTEMNRSYPTPEELAFLDRKKNSSGIIPPTTRPKNSKKENSCE